MLLLSARTIFAEKKKEIHSVDEQMLMCESTERFVSGVHI